MGAARKMARFSRKAQGKALLCESQYKADITEVVIREMFAMSFMALHDEFKFGKDRIMRFYKKMLSLNRELRLHGGDKPLDTLLVALNDEYKFDLNKAMVEANKQFDEEVKKEQVND